MDVDSSSTVQTEPDQDTAIQSEESPNPDPVEQPPDQSSGGSPNPGTATPVAGPRLAPTYTVVNAILEKKEDGPGPRCGHTLTAVAAVGEEGTPGYIGPRLILFGGATALEGNSAASGTPSPTSAGSAGISMCLNPTFRGLFELISLS